VHSQDALSKSRLDKKRSLSEATVAAAGDGDNATMLNAAAGPSLANSSIQSLVDKAVKAAVRQVTQRGGPRGRGGRGGARGAAPPASQANASATLRRRDQGAPVEAVRPEAVVAEVVKQGGCPGLVMS
jgi:hypothetical protein